MWSTRQQLLVGERGAAHRTCAQHVGAVTVAGPRRSLASKQMNGDMLRETEKVEQPFISASAREVHKRAGLPLPPLRRHTVTLPPASTPRPLRNYSSPPSRPPRGHALALIACVKCARDDFIPCFVHTRVHSKAETNNGSRESALGVDTWSKQHSCVLFRPLLLWIRRFTGSFGISDLL